jgi:hypothetical protein
VAVTAGETTCEGASTTLPAGRHKRTMIVDRPAGAYQVACKPGMVGNGNRRL